MSFARYPFLLVLVLLVLILAACGQRPPIETSIFPSANESPTPFINVNVASAQTEQTPTVELAPTEPNFAPATFTSTPAATATANRTATPPPTPRGARTAAPGSLTSAGAQPAEVTGSSNQAACFGSINGSVVSDLNSNGEAESGEPGVMGAKLFLYNSTGVVGLYTTGNGQFYFPGLVAGEYTLTAAPPLGFTPSGQPTFDLTVDCDATITQNILLNGASTPTPTRTATAVSQSRITPVASGSSTPRPSASGAPTGTNFKPFTVAAVYDIAGCGSINAPGLYRLAVSLTSQWDCIQINSDNVVHQIGNVLSQRPARNIEIRNCKSQKHKYGVFIDAADNLYIHDNELSNHFRDTDERNFGQFLGLSEGGGMRLGTTTNALIANNITDNNAIGIDIRNGSGITVRGNRANGNSAWGIHLYNVQFSELSDNTAADNLRYCTWGNGTVGPGCDAGGIMLQSGSSRNVIKNNTITGANGNGIFVKAHGTACGDGNTIQGNTIRGSLYNAIELSFCRDNKIAENRINDSLDGIWLGFAKNNELVGNQIQDLANHGIISWNSSDNNISTNTIVNSREGLYFYSGEYDREQFFFVQGSPEDHASRGNCLCDNTLLNNVVAAIHLNNSFRNQITQNRLTNNGVNFVMEGNTAGNIIQDNVIEGGSFHFGAPGKYHVSFAAKPSALSAFDSGGRSLSRAEFVKAILTDLPGDSFDLYYFKLKMRATLGLTNGAFE
jgi:parallel beta-helix repeat protein